MKVAVVYNRDSRNVINLFGTPNREKIGLAAIKRITDGLKAGGHQVTSLEADKDLIDRLEEFMPRVVKGERPGLVLNLSYGIQGQARYTHVPSILEMVGIPYVGSGPLAHSIALDKVVTKMILVQHGLPTPGFAVLESPEFEVPDLEYPLIVKPKNEAVSFGIKVCHDEAELREASQVIFDKFGQEVLVERFIEGREVNVGLLGNGPPQTLPPVELVFGSDGPTVYSYEDKTGRSGRKIELRCPAPLDEAMTERAQSIALKAFQAVGCADCARVDMRIDEQGELSILEINSLPSLGPRGSYVRAAEEIGLDFAGLVNRLVEVAAARYFGTPKPTVSASSDDPQGALSAFVTSRRDRIERRLKHWVSLPSRTGDPVGLQLAGQDLGKTLVDLGLREVPEFSDGRSALMWESRAGFRDGTLMVSHLDVPLGETSPFQAFRREPEWLFGEGIGTSRAPLVSIEFALRALRHLRVLAKRKVGVLVVLDEGRDAQDSAPRVRDAMASAGRVLVLRPSGTGNQVITGRRGQRKFRLVVEGEPVWPGRAKRQPLVWFAEKLREIDALTSKSARRSVSVSELRTEAFPMLLPHRLTGSLLVTYADPDRANEAEAAVRKILGKKGPKWTLAPISDRPPLARTKRGRELARELGAAASAWDIPLNEEDSSWPSVAGLAPESVPVACGLGPVSRDLYTPHEAVQRLSVIQRTLLLAQFLLQSS